MAKGKMNGSPFHVENPRYKYAVEHEAEPKRTAKKMVDCPFYQLPGEICNLWNSGYAVCDESKCRYFNTECQRNRECTSCALFSEKCYHPYCSGNKEDETVACYCCYFRLPKGTQTEKNTIDNIVRRLYLTEHIEHLNGLVATKRISIYEKEKLMKDKNCGEHVVQLRNKLLDQLERVKQDIKIETDELNRIGGPLNGWPMKKENKNGNS